MHTVPAASYAPAEARRRLGKTRCPPYAESPGRRTRAAQRPGDETMAKGFGDEDDVHDQIESTIDDAVQRARSGLPRGESLTHCEECGDAIPQARRQALPGVRLCVGCQAERDRESGGASLYNRRGSKDSQLR
jgi:phage/conjugal plasmid C-4 type zinc finger TraR family protein